MSRQHARGTTATAELAARGKAVTVYLRAATYERMVRLRERLGRAGRDCPWGTTIEQLLDHYDAHRRKT